MSPGGSYHHGWGGSTSVWPSPDGWHSSSVAYNTPDTWSSAPCPTGASICDGKCFLTDSCGGEYAWTPSSDLPPIATNFVTVDADGRVVSSSIECNSNAFAASYPTDIASYVTQQLGPSCDLELVADGSTVTQTAGSGSFLYLGNCGMHAVNVPISEGATCCSNKADPTWTTPAWYTGSFFYQSGHSSHACAVPSLWHAAPPLSSFTGCSVVLPSEKVTFPGPSTTIITVSPSKPTYPPPGKSTTTTTKTTTTSRVVYPSPPPPDTTTTTEFIPTISVDIVTSKDSITFTKTIPPIVYSTTFTTSLSGSTSTVVSTFTQQGSISVVTQTVTRTQLEETTLRSTDFVETTVTSVDLEETTVTSIDLEQTTVTSIDLERTTVTVTVPTTEVVSLIPVSGTVISLVKPSPTISNVVTGPPCAAPPVQSYFDVSWYYYAPPSSGIPPLATHQPIVFPNNETSTSIFCNTSVFEKYLRTHLYDCSLGRGAYQTLDRDCNIVVGPIFTGNGPTPTGPGITVTQSGPSGTILDLGTSIVGHNLPVAGAGGQVFCASTTTTTLPNPLIYTGEVTVVPSFYRTVRIQLAKKAVPSAETSNLIIPGLTSPQSGQASLSPFVQPHGVATGSKGNTVSGPGAITTTLDPIPYSDRAKNPLPQSMSSTTRSSSPSTGNSPPLTTSTKKSTSTKKTTITTQPTPSPATPSPQNSSNAVTPSSSPSQLSSPQTSPATGLGQVHTTNVCQVVTYTGQAVFTVPELVVNGSSTVTETALASELTAGINSYVCSIVGGCEPNDTVTGPAGSAGASTTAAAASGSVTPATGHADALQPAWWLLAVTLLLALTV